MPLDVKVRVTISRIDGEVLTKFLLEPTYRDVGAFKNMLDSAPSFANMVEEYLEQRFEWGDDWP